MFTSRQINKNTFGLGATYQEKLPIALRKISEKQHNPLKLLQQSTALSVALLCTGFTPAHAEDQAAKPLQLPPVSVEGDAKAKGYQTEKAESPKRTAPLRDTPQTVTVIPAQVLQEQNLLSLREALSTVPGITFGAGEGGGGYGDSVNLRGYSANADITTDSLRDSAQYTRSDSFNTEGIEVFNGANSVYAGAGSVGGSINVITKQPKAENFTRVQASIGLDDYYRGAADTNQLITDTVAVRINAVAHKNDIPGRDVEEDKRWGIAPSVTFGLGTPTRVTLNFHHQEDDNLPQYGVPYVFSAFNPNGVLPGVDDSDYFGYSNVDQQDIRLDTFTAKIEHDFGDGLSIRNMTRWQQVTQYSIVSQPQGTFCLANGTNPATGSACTPVNSFTPSGRGTTRDTTNNYLVNQLDVMANFNTGALTHNFVVGGAGSHETFALDSGNVLRTATGATPTFATTSLSNPDNIYTGPINYFKTGTQDGALDNIAVYAFDTVTIIPQLEFNAGLRYEYNKGDFTSATYTNGVFTTQTPVFRNDEHLVSYRAGLVYKPVEEASIYVAYGNTKTPSKSAVNGTCTSGTFGAATFINNCNVDPENGKTYEIGAKWDVAGEMLSLNAAVFRNDRSNYKVASGDPLVPTQVLDGSARVDGVALGAVGTIIDGWQVFANYTYLDSEVRQGVSDYVLRTTGIDAQAGNPLTNTPKNAFSAWTTYVFPIGVTLGYGATYQSKIYVTNGAAPRYTSPGYWVHRAMAAYAVNEQLSLQLNITNLFDKEYYTRVRTTTSGWATPGESRTAILTANYTF